MLQDHFLGHCGLEPVWQYFDLLQVYIEEFRPAAGLNNYVHCTVKRPYVSSLICKSHLQHKCRPCTASWRMIPSRCCYSTTWIKASHLTCQSDLPFLHKVAIPISLSRTQAQMMRPGVDWNTSCVVRDLQYPGNFITIHWLFMNDNHRLLWPVTTHGSGEVNCKYSFNMLLVVPICSSGYEGHHSPITYKPWNSNQASHIRQHIIQPPNSKSDST